MQTSSQFSRSFSLFSAVLAEFLHTAICTIGSPRDTCIPSVKHASVTEIVAFFRRQKVPQLHFNFERVLRIDKPEQVCDSDNMGIGDNRGLFIDIPHNQVCRFSADAGQRCQLFKRVGHLRIIFVNHHSAHRDNISRLCPEKSAGMNDSFNIGDIRAGEVLHCFVFLKQLRRHEIDSRIRALRRKACRYQKLKRIFRLKRTQRAGILFSSASTAASAFCFKVILFTCSV